MSNQNSSSQQPNPLETEAFLEDSSSPTIEVSAVPADSEESTDDQDPTAIAPANGVEDEEEKVDGFLLARKLRQHNRELVKTVVQLEQALAESQEKLQEQMTRSRSADSLISQQADTLGENQQRVASLAEELQRAKQEIIDQRAIINEVNNKLKRSQTHLAQVERECTLLQESYNEQQQKLIVAEQEIKDLQTRLQRQQRYAIQYKAALEQQGLDINAVPEVPPVQASVPKVTHIRPWSEQKLEPKPLSALSSDIPTTPEAIAFPQQDTAPESPKEELPNNEVASVILPLDVNEDLDQQLQDLEEEMDAMSEDVPETPVTPTVPAPSLKVPAVLERKPMVAAAARPQVSAPISPMIASTQRNWPSPTLNPMRNPKKRESLAAVELPTFSRR